MATFFIGTSNAKKIAEIRSILGESRHAFLFPSDIDLVIPDPVETGTTYVENALIKARAYAIATGLPTFSEDSGLEVTALDGFPGVKSNRWLVGSETDRCLALLAKLETFDDRSAQFSNCIAFVDPSSGESQTFTGVLKGTIARELSGKEGFGYDPIFIPEGEEKTLASLGQEWKNAHSARKLSWSQVLQFVTSFEIFSR